MGETRKIFLADGEKPAYLSSSALRSYPNTLICAHPPAERRSCAHPPTDSCAHPPTERRTISYNACILGCHSSLMKSIFMDQLRGGGGGGADETTFRVILAADFADEFIDKLDEFLREGEISGLEKVDLDALDADFQTMGIFLPDTFWSSNASLRLRRRRRRRRQRIKVEVKRELSSDCDARDGLVRGDAHDGLVRGDAREGLVRGGDDGEGAEAALLATPKRKKRPRAVNNDDDDDEVDSPSSQVSKRQSMRPRTNPNCQAKLKKKAMLERRGNSLSVPFQVRDAVPCPCCSKLFDDSLMLKKYKALNTHLWKKHKHSLGEFICSECGDAFATADDCKAHVFNAHDVVKEVVVDFAPKSGKGQTRTYQCTECARVSDKRFFLVDHLYTFHDVKAFAPCNICHIKFMHKADWLEHTRTASNPDGSFATEQKCDICRRVFGNRCAYTKHMETCSALAAGPKLTCVACGRQFSHLYKMQLHKDHMGSYHDAVCVYRECGVAFASWKEHEAHVSAAHRNKFLVKCGKCGQVFEKEHNRRSHVLAVHPGPTKDVCSICGAGISQYSNMRKHTEMFHSEKSHACETCGKLFGGPSTLAEHRKVHDRPTVTCELCGMEVRKNCWLRHQRQKHTAQEDMPYQCSLCGKGFAEKGKFTIHMNIHQDLRPYKCSECQSTFNDVANRNQHERKVHKLVDNGRVSYS